MNKMDEIFKKLEALDESEVSQADQAILEFCLESIKQERESREKQEVRFSAILQALGRHLNVDEGDLERIFVDTNNHINDHWGDISLKLDQDLEFARIISGIVKDKEKD